MRKLSGVLAAASTAVLVAAATTLTGMPANAESNGGVRVMPLGDSITDGYNVPGGYRIDLWQKLVAGGYKIDLVGSLSNGPANLGDHDHEGHSGWTIAQIDANVVGWLRTYTPRTVLLHIGTNDMWSTAATAPQRLSTLIDHITETAPSTEVFVSTIIPRSGADSAVRTYNAAIPGIVQSKANAGKRVHLVDMYPAVTLTDLPDGIHPNAGGYSKMATVWHQALLAVPGSIGDNAPPTSAPTTTPPTTSPTTPPTTSPTTPPTTSPTGQPGGCTATYRLVNSWSGGLQAEVTVRNGGTSALTGWTVRMTLPGGQSISNLWNGVNTGTSGVVSVRNAAYNGAVPASGSTAFGYVASGSSAAAPTGVTCSAA